MRRELPIERRDELFASHSPELERREEEGTRLEEWGMPREEEGTRHFELFMGHSPFIAYHSPEGMSLDLFFMRLESQRIQQKQHLSSYKGIVMPSSSPLGLLQERLVLSTHPGRLSRSDLT